MPECDIESIYDEFDGQKLIVIRWNLDSYLPQKGEKVSRKDRLNALKELIVKVLANPPDELYTFTICIITLIMSYSLKIFHMN